MRHRKKPDLSVKTEWWLKVTFQFTEWHVYFSDHSVTIQWPFSYHSVTIWSIFNSHIVNFQWSFSHISVTIQWHFSDHSVIFQWPFSRLSVIFQWPFSHISVTIQSYFSDHSVIFQRPFYFYICLNNAGYPRVQTIKKMNIFGDWHASSCQLGYLYR